MAGNAQIDRTKILLGGWGSEGAGAVSKMPSDVSQGRSERLFEVILGVGGDIF